MEAAEFSLREAASLLCSRTDLHIFAEAGSVNVEPLLQTIILLPCVRLFIKRRRGSRSSFSWTTNANHHVIAQKEAPEQLLEKRGLLNAEIGSGTTPRISPYTPDAAHGDFLGRRRLAPARTFCHDQQRFGSF
ncbi:hypothetical protein TNCV_4425951 [Trichonephila clavipes]|nr:hypothetical protein TNCV_4425951 [Trichonephila clavipes]